MGLLNDIRPSTQVFAVAPGGFNLVGATQCPESLGPVISIRIPSAMEIQGLVLDDSNGAPVEGAEVDIVSRCFLPASLQEELLPEWPSRTVPTNKGEFHMSGVLARGLDGRPLNYWLTASAPQYAPLANPSVSGAPGACVSVTFRLKPAPRPQGSLTGRVLTANGQPQAGAWIGAVCTVRSGSGACCTHSHEVETRVDGTFSVPLADFVPHVEPDGTVQGEVLLQVRASGSPGALVAVADVRESVTVTLPAGTAVHGRVLTHERQPAARVKINVYREGKDELSELLICPIVTSETDAGGWFDVALDPHLHYLIVAESGDLNAFACAEGDLSSYTTASGPPTIELERSLDSYLKELPGGLPGKPK